MGSSLRCISLNERSASSVQRLLNTLTLKGKVNAKWVHRASMDFDGIILWPDSDIIPELAELINERKDGVTLIIDTDFISQEKYYKWHNALLKQVDEGLRDSVLTLDPNYGGPVLDKLVSQVA